MCHEHDNLTLNIFGQQPARKKGLPCSEAIKPGMNIELQVIDGSYTLVIIK